ncbi:MAG: sulfatase-like hydrolase/transferase, partial [Planctomycetota bacterium]
MADSKPSPSHNHLILCTVVIAAAARGLALMHREISWNTAELHGFAADIVAGAWVGLAVILLHRWKAVSAAIAVAAWAVANFLAAEHVRILGAWPDIQHVDMLVDPSFILGSAIKPAHPWAILLAIALGTAVVHHTPRTHHAQHFKRGLILAVVATVAFYFVPAPRGVESWRTQHVVIQNLTYLWKDTSQGGVLNHVRESIPISSTHEEQVEIWLTPDLDGQRLTQPPASIDKPNVLLVVIEGLGGDRVGPIHGIAEPHAEMPHLSALASRGLLARRFVNQQQQTNRGTYTLLSGDLPGMLVEQTPRISIFNELPPRPYLPQVLARNSYHTLYLQAADLAFMAKAPFLKAAGFDDLHDTIGFPDARRYSPWGVDDLTLMEETIRLIDQLEANPDSKPWFAMVLTVGTHHPYVVPADFVKLENETPDQWAFRYADLALEH